MTKAFFEKRVSERRKVKHAFLAAILFLPVFYFALNMIIGDRGFIKAMETRVLIKETAQELKKEKERRAFLIASHLALLYPEDNPEIVEEKSFENFGYVPR